MDESSTRDLLTAERDATRARLAALSAEVDGVVSAAAGSNIDDEHDPEGATLAFEREQLAALREQARQHLDELELALQRLAAGRYGVCETCGAPIGEERLAARPFARQCVSCAAKAR
ncbi:MAG TPA: TraR/DksA C4-type zinc finger protein [Jatrophihabitans sp.]|nr:TraR/DksA C4-type zinc finger protein [Jatrophihabitans sp.]